MNKIPIFIPKFALDFLPITQSLATQRVVLMQRNTKRCLQISGYPADKFKSCKDLNLATLRANFAIAKFGIIFSFFLLANIFLSGCTVHRFEKSQKLGGYAVARFGYVIPEYTVDSNNKAPEDFNLAKERYKRRKDTVEVYYLKMNQIESYFRRYVGHFPAIMWSIFANTWKMPFHIVSEYRYEHNEEYRKRIDDLDREEKAREDEKINRLRNELNEFLKQDLEKEKQPADALVKSSTNENADISPK